MEDIFSLSNSKWFPPSQYPAIFREQHRDIESLSGEEHFKDFGWNIKRQSFTQGQEKIRGNTTRG